MLVREKVRICPKCGKEKILRSKKWICRDCQILAQKKHYNANRLIEIKKRRDRSERIKREHYEYLISIKSVPCIDCRLSFPHYVMEFDHVGGSKVNNVSNMLGGSFEKLLLEIAKCEIVCSNCHKGRTWRRNHASLV